MQSKYNHRAIKNKAASLVALCEGPAYVDLLQSRIERATSTTLCKGALAPALRALCRERLVEQVASPVAALSERPERHRPLTWYAVTQEGRAVAAQLKRSLAGFLSLGGAQ